MPYIGNVTTSSNVNGSQINNGTITGDKLSQPFDYDNATLYLDAVNNRVGIGTTSPSAPLDLYGANNALCFRIDGASGATDRALRISNSANSLLWDINAQGGSGASGFLTLSTNSTERLRITSSGNVGIGTTSPQARLEIGGSGQLFINQDQRLQWNIAGNATIRADIRGTSANEIVFGNRVGGVLTDTMVLDGSGRLLVGTSSARSVGGSIVTPQIQLESPNSGIAGFSVITNRNDAIGPSIYLGKSRAASNGGITLVASGDTLGDIRFAGADGTDIETLGAVISCEVDGTPGANDMPGRLLFSTTADGASSPTERMRINSSGRVGIGTSSPSSILDINGDLQQRNGSSVTIGKIENASGWYSLTGDVANVNGAQISHSTAVRVITNGNERLRIDSSGNVGIGTSSPGSKLEVRNDISATTSLDSTALKLYNNQDGGSGIEFSNGVNGKSKISFGVESTGAGTNETYLGFSTCFEAGALTERLRIDSIGRVVIGSGSADSVSRVTVNGSSDSTYGIGIVNSYSATANSFYAHRYFQGATHLGGLWWPNSTSELIRHSALNGIAFHTGSSTEGPERLRIDSSGNVGIATATPRGLLSIANNNSVSGVVNSSLHFGYSNADYYGFRITNSNDPAATAAGLLKFQRGNLSSWADAMVIDNSGNVGIGTVSPGNQNTTQVTTDNDGIRVQFSGTPIGGQGPRLIFGHNTNNGTQQIFAAIKSLMQGGNDVNWVSDLAFYTGGSSLTERARIDFSGRLLVGTSTSRVPNASIDASQLQIEGATYPASSLSLICNQNNTDSSYLVFGKSRGGTIGSSTIVNAGDLLGAFWFCGADGSTLPRGAMIEAFVDGTPGANDMPGRLVFSTTADGAASPTEAMRIDSSRNLILRGGNLDFAPSGTKAFALAYNSTDFYITNSNFSNYAQLVGQSFTGWTFGSDARIKENIEDLEYGIAQLKALKPRRFNFIGQDFSTIGFIAQEVWDVVPEAVSGEEIPYEETDTPQEKANKTLGLAKETLIPLITKALQEAIAKIETLEARLTAAGIE